MRQEGPAVNVPWRSNPSKSGEVQQQSTQTQQQASILLVVLLGLPGAGKTTLATILCDAARKKQVHSHHLCLDELVQRHSAARSNEAAGNNMEKATTLAFSTEAWQACRHELQQQAEAIMQRAHAEADMKAAAGPEQHPSQQQPTSLSCRMQPATHYGHSQQHQQQALHPQSLPERVLVLVDDNNFYQSMRYQFFQLARRYAAAFLQVYLECPLELALARNQGRDGTGCIPEAVLRRCASLFESPDSSKRHWERGRTLTLQPGDVPLLVATRTADDSINSAADRLWLQLLQHWGPAVPPMPDPAELEALKDACTAANLSSRVHQADLASRAMLNAVLEQIPTEHKLQVAHELNKQRKCMLQCLRNQPPAATTGVMDEFVQSFHQICLSVTVQSLR